MKQFLFLLSLVLMSNQSVFAKNNHTIEWQERFIVDIKPAEKNGQFDSNTKVNYQIFIKNKSSKLQEGNVIVLVNDLKGKEESRKIYDISIPANQKIETTISIPQEKDGKFYVKFFITLNKIESLYEYPFTYNLNSTENLKSNTINSTSKDDTDGEIKSFLKPANEDGIFIGKAPIVYHVYLENTYSITETGKIGYTVKDAVTGAAMSEKQFELKMEKNSSKSMEFKITPPEKPGIYNVELAINTNTYDDTTRYSFGYEIAKINNPYYRPTDFDEFWKQALDELELVNPQYSIVEDPFKTSKDYFVYKIEMNSLDSIRINGWLTIPRLMIKGKNFPVIISYSGYQIKSIPLKSADFVNLTINARGFDKENMENINPEGEELFTLNIDNPKRYVYRGIYMDCVRALDFIIANKEMGFDISKIAVTGGSQGGALALIVGGLMNKKVKTVIADNPTLCDFHISMEMQNQLKTESFLINYINKYIIRKNNAVSKSQVLNTLSYFEVQNFIPNISCPVLMGAGLLDPVAPAATTIGAFNKLKPSVQRKSEIYTFPNLAHEVSGRHNRFKSVWLYEKLAE